MVCANGSSYGLDIDSVMAHKCSPSVTAGCWLLRFQRRQCDLSAFKMSCLGPRPFAASDTLNYDLKYTCAQGKRDVMC